MHCPDCNHENTSIPDTRTIKDGTAVRRRRECTHCGFRFTTYERTGWDSLRVKNRDGSLEPFNPDKIRRGIELAVEKRPVTPEQVTQLVEDITATVKARDERVVPSHVIGDLVVERLRELDQVAYVRFVSVYKSFSNPEDFNAVLDSLLDEQSQPGTGDTT